MAIDENLSEHARPSVREAVARFSQSRALVYGSGMLATLLLVAGLWPQPWVSMAEIFGEMVSATGLEDACCSRYFRSEAIQQAVFLFIGIATFLAVEVIYLSLSHRAAHKRKIKQRLEGSKITGLRQDVLVQLRRSKSQTTGRFYMLPVQWLNQMILQSGSRLGLHRLLALDGAFSIFAFVTIFHFLDSLMLAATVTICAAVIIPLMVLKILVRRRRQQLENQLPDAVDIMTRSLKAGHPLNVSIAMVGREMPDPIGTEFALAVDELTYGLDLESAMNKMSDRVGQEDLALLVTAITIQSQTGGNITQVLSNLSSILRARFQMRHKVKAMSAEGRFSGLFISALPIAIFAALMLVAPGFYGGIWHEPAVRKVLGLAAVVLLAGNLVMHRIINFKH